MLAQTGWTSLKAAGFTLAGNTAIRYAVGRSRPNEGLGNTNLSPFGNGAMSSGFPSNHVGTAFALVTPFAQQYDMPWLYGVASTAAFGRIQQREHWLSDVVAGGIMGYAVGSLMLDQQREKRPGQARLAFGVNGISSQWEFN
jgi:membrane-associated phospholipid phosphatase